MSNFLNMDEYKRRTSLRVEKKDAIMANEESDDSSIKCPKCKEAMSMVKHGAITMDKCEFCQGYWLKEGQIEYLCEHLKPHQLDKLNTIGQSKARKKDYRNLFHFDNRMKCPSCPKDLREVYFKLNSKIKLDICDRCQGVFYDADELKAVIVLIKGIA